MSAPTVAPPMRSAQIRPRRMSLQTRRTYLAYLFLAPALIGLVTFLLIPLVWGIWISFTDFKFLSQDPANWVGWSNYVEALNDPLMWTSLGRAALARGATVGPRRVVGTTRTTRTTPAGTTSTAAGSSGTATSTVAARASRPAVTGTGSLAVTRRGDVATRSAPQRVGTRVAAEVGGPRNPRRPRAARARRAGRVGRPHGLRRGQRVGAALGRASWATAAGGGLAGARARAVRRGLACRSSHPRGGGYRPVPGRQRREVATWDFSPPVQSPPTWNTRVRWFQAQPGQTSTT